MATDDQSDGETPGGYTPRGRLQTPDDINLAEFFTRDDGRETVVRNSDLEATVPNKEKGDLIEVDRYWVRKPYAFVTIFKTKSEDEYRYIVVEPELTPEEQGLITFLKDKMRTSLDYSNVRTRATQEQRIRTLREKALELLRNYNLIDQEKITNPEQAAEKEEPTTLASLLNTVIDVIYERTRDDDAESESNTFTSQKSIRQTLDRSQVEKILYYVIRDFIRYDRIDPIMRDPSVEDISIDGWGGTVFLEHAEFEQMNTNVSFGREDLDEFVTNLAQKANKGISKRQPRVDATLEDGSRAILILGDEVTEKGSTFTIRDFNDIPFTPIDLINWGTYSIDQMVYLWLATEHRKSAIIAGGTGSGKTTTLNALSLFIPATKKIVSIEDTRELRVPQSMWVPLNTRESFASGDGEDITEIDLLWDSLRMSPEYVIYGEVRGKEARSLFQNLNTGHTAYSTFHGKNAKEVRVRLTTNPINVDDTSFAGLDFILTQDKMDIDGEKVRRATSIVEIDEYLPDLGEFATSQPFSFNKSNDEIRGDLSIERIQSKSPMMESIREENGWTYEELRREINRRKVVLAYMVENNINAYTDVAATVQGYMASPENVLTKIADGSLSSNASTFHDSKNLNIDVDPRMEAGVPRPTSSARMKSKCSDILEENRKLYEDISITTGEEGEASKISELEGRSASDSTDSTDQQPGESPQSGMWE